jgi:hypothetical protein
MLVATTVVAIALGAVVALDVPFSHPVVRSFLAVYLVFFGVWAAFRGPRVLLDLSDVAQRRRQLRDKRAALEREVRAIRESRSASESPPREE